MDRLTVESQAPKRGRPKSVEPRTASVSTWLTPRDADRLIRLARKSDQHVSALVRQIITSKLG